MIKAGIIGGAGYTGGELIRLLLRHPSVTLSFVHSKSSAGQPLYSVHQDLLGDTEMNFTDELNSNIDVLFLCTGHGEAKKFLEAHPQPASVAIIDLSNDFRLQANRRFQGRDFIYGLPELNRNAIKAMAGKENLAIANPGCFATTIQVGLLPLAQEGWLDEVYTTGITGSTGAGQSLSATSHFSWRANNIQAYKTLNHQHLGEIGESLLQCQRANETKASGGGQQEKQGVSANQNSLEISFVPWRGDFTRGIFVSSTITLDKPLPLLIDLFKSFYQSHPFTHVSKEPIFLKQVVNTNKALVQLEKVGTKLVIHSAMDNLLKGASGQAVQNMNLLFRRPETEGLQLKAGYF